MRIYNSATAKAVRQSVGSLLAIIFFLLWGLATFAAFGANDNDMPGYPLFYICCPALFVCSILLGMKKIGGVRGIQVFSAVAFLGLLLSKVRNDAVALTLDIAFFGGAAALAEWVSRLEGAPGFRGSNVNRY